MLLLTIVDMGLAMIQFLKLETSSNTTQQEHNDALLQNFLPEMRG